MLRGVPEQPKFLLVVDTNVIWSDTAYQDSVAWKKLLLYAAKYASATFVIPEVVMQERARQEADRIASCRSEGARALSQARAAFARAGVMYPEAPSVRDLRDLKLASRQDLYEQMSVALAAAGIEVAPIPAIAHETLVLWSIEAHPPFDSTDKGYRDALIWRTVREVAARQKNGTSVLFVTEDRDYTQRPDKKAIDANGKPKRVLHAKLAADLERATTNVVLVIASLEEASSHLDQPERDDSAAGSQDSGATNEKENSAPANDEQHAGEATTDKFSEVDLRPTRVELMKEAIERSCDLFVGNEIGSSDGGLNTGFEFAFRDVENATVSEVIPDLSTLMVDVHEQFEGDTVTGEASIKAEVRYEGYVFKADSYSEDATWTVIDRDWNEHYVVVEGELQSELKFQFVLNDQDLTLEFYDIDLYE